MERTIKIVEKSTGNVAAEILTNHSMSLDDAIDLVGCTEWEKYDNWLQVIIDGKIYDYDDLDLEY